MPERTSGRPVWVPGRILFPPAEASKGEGRPGEATVETYMPEKDPKGLRPASETPAYLMRRPYILNYYRVNYTAWDCIKSLFTLHNETANIWTHIVGFFIWLAMLKSTTQEQTFLKDNVSRKIGFLLRGGDES